MEHLCSKSIIINFIKDANKFLPNIAQLLDGWHVDTAWTDDDTKVRQQVSLLLKQADELRNIVL